MDNSELYEGYSLSQIEHNFNCIQELATVVLAYLEAHRNERPNSPLIALPLVQIHLALCNPDVLSTVSKVITTQPSEKQVYNCLMDLIRIGAVSLGPKLVRTHRYYITKYGSAMVRYQMKVLDSEE